MATFSDFYQQQAADLSALPPVASAPKPLDISSLHFGGAASSSNAPQSPLNWAMDILSRPLYGVTNAISGAIDQSVQAGKDFSSGDAGGGVANIAGAAFGALPRFLEGMFTTDESKHQTTSKLIEHATDTIGKAVDPTYVDRQDNVNPWVKGIAGFAGDIALDPLTWIPGAQIAKGAKVVGDLVKGGVDLVKGVTKSEDAVKAVTDIRDAVKVTNSPLPVDNIGQEIPMPKLGQARTEATTPAAVQPFGGETSYRPVDLSSWDLTGTKLSSAPTEAGPSFRELIDSSAQGKALQSEMKSISDSVGKQMQPMSRSDWLRQNKDVQVPGVVPTRLMPNSGKLTYGKAWAMAQGAHQAGDVQRANDLKRLVDEGYDVHAKNSTQTFANAFEAFQHKVREDETRMTGIFGDRLLTTLREKNSPEAFDRTMSNINRVFDPATDLGTFERANKKLLGALRETMQIPAHVSASANTADDIARAAALSTQLRDTFGHVSDAITPGTQAFAQKYVTHKNGVAFTAGDEATRTGKILGQFNTFDQYSTVKAYQDKILQEMQNITGKANNYGSERAKAYRDAFDNVMSDVSQIAAIHGHKLTIGVGKDLVPLSMDEVYRAVYSNFADSEKALLALYNGGSAAALTTVLQAAHKAVMAGDLESLGREGVRQLRKDLIEGLLDPAKFGVKGKAGQKITSNLQRTNADGYAFAKMSQAEAAAKKLPGGRAIATKNGAGRVVFDARQLAGDLADAVIKAQPELVRSAATNAAAWTERVADEASHLSNAAVKGVQDTLATGTDAEVLNKIAGISSDISKAAELMGATPQSVGVAVDVARLSLGDQLMKEARIFGSLEREIKSVEPHVFSEGVAKSTQRQVDAAVEDFDKAFAQPEAMPETAMAVKAKPKPDDHVPTHSIGATDEADTLQHVTSRLLPGALHRLFNLKYGVERVLDAQLAGQSVARQMLGNKSRQLNVLARKYGPKNPALTEAFQAMQRGDTPAHLSGEMNDLMGVIGDLLPINKDSFIDMPMLRADGQVANLNAAMKDAFWGYSQVPSFDWGAAKIAAKQARGKGKPTAGEIGDQVAAQWRQWQIQDPLDFANRLSSATASVVERQAAMGTFLKRFTDNGLISTTKPGPNMVRVVNGGKSAFRSYLPDTLYVDKELAGELGRLDWLVRAPQQMDGRAGHFIRSYFLPVQNAWKRDITVMRPGHHIRNFIGDSSITWMTRGSRDFLPSYNDAQKVLSFKNNYSDLDLIDTLRRARNGDFELPQGGDLIASGKIGGKQVQFTNETVHAALSQYGLLSDFHKAEDLLDDAVEGQNIVRKISKAVSFEGTRVGEFAGGVAEYTAHMGRAQHFIQALKQELAGKGKFGAVKSQDELLQKVADEVRRAHPDGAMLTPAERKYMRVLIPFYSWFSKTLPFALEQAARHPGRLTAFPKASYNLAVAMGINPDTLSDPFPNDQLFPSFLTGGFFGPQFKTSDGKYINVNPGFAPTDVFASIGQNPVRGVLGMVSPLIRVPAELASGGSWSTGAPIKSPADYIDSNLPFVGALANMTGISPTGTVEGLLSGQGVKQQAQVAAGNKDGFDQGLSLINYLTGMNIQNYSRPNYINYAEIEKRNAAGKAAGGK